MRAQCCPDAPALTSIQEVSECKLEASLAYLANALDDGKAMEQALRDYRTAIDCIVEEGYAESFGRGGPPYGFELRYIETLLGRLRRVRR
jgi:hypothetical protein